MPAVPEIRPPRLCKGVGGQRGRAASALGHAAQGVAQGTPHAPSSSFSARACKRSWLAVFTCAWSSSCSLVRRILTRDLPMDR
eukprot:6183830-Pleurochrysis_carterae.AAC.2